MSRLERRYRRLLRLLPGWYRADREDEMIDTFLAGRGDGLDEVDNEYGWPGWPQTWAIVALAARTRLAADQAPPRAVLAGNAVRLAALLGLLLYAAGEAASAVVSVFGLATGPAWPVTGQEVLLAVLAGTAAVVLAFVLLVAGLRREAKTLVLVAVAVSVLELALRVRLSMDLPRELWSPLANLLPLWVAAGCLLAGFHREAPRPSTVPWLGWLAAATVLILAWRWPAFGVVTPTSVWVYAVFLDPGFLVVVAVGAAALARPRWAPGLAIVAFTWLPDRLDAVRVAGILGLPPLVVLATIAAVALAAAATLLTIKATRDLRRLPADDTIWAPRDVT